MAIAISEPTPEVATTTNTDTLATAAFTPAANSVLVAIVHALDSVLPTPTFTDSEGAWTLKTVFNWPTGDLAHCSYVFWRKVGGSPVSIQPTFDCTGDPFIGCAIHPFQAIPDVLVAGDPIRQVAVNDSALTPSANPSVTFASALKTANGYVASMSREAVGVTPPTSWTETAEHTITAPGQCFWGAYRAGGETGTTITATAAAEHWAMLAVEVYNDQPRAAPAVYAYYRRMMSN